MKDKNKWLESRWKELAEGFIEEQPDLWNDYLDTQFKIYRL